MKKSGVAFLLIMLVMIIGSIACSQQEEGKVLSAEITPALYDRDSIVTIIADDGFYEPGICLNELAKKYDICITVAGYTNALNNDAQGWQEIEKDGKIDIISHSYTHTVMSEEANLDSKTLEHEIKDSIKYCDKKFDTSQIAFVPPENTMCEEGYKLLAELGIYAVRQACGGLNSLSPEQGTEAGNWYNLCAYGICGGETSSERNEWIDEAIAEKAWLIEMWHNVTEPGEEWGFQPISIPLAEEHVSYLLQKSEEGKVWVASFVQATKYIYEKQNAMVNVFYNGKIIKVKLQCDIETKNKSEFNFPLTVKIQLPEELDEVDNFEVRNKKVRIKEENGNRYALIEMVPNTSCKVEWETDHEKSSIN